MSKFVSFRWMIPAFALLSLTAGCANDGGGSAGLAWVNNVTCTPGEKFEIAVGIGRRTQSTASSYWAGSTWLRRVEDAGYGVNEFIAIGYGG